MRSTVNLQELPSELKQDLIFVEEQSAKNRQMTERLNAHGAADEFDYAAFGWVN